MSKENKNLYNFVKHLTRNVNKHSVFNLVEEDRKQKIEMNPGTAFRNRQAINTSEKNNIITNILEDIEKYKLARSDVNDGDRRLGTFLISNCDGCKKDYNIWKNKIILDEQNKKIPKTWSNYFSYRDGDYCGVLCEFNNLEMKDGYDEMTKDALFKFKSNYEKLYTERFNLNREYNKLGIKYRVVLEQKQSLLESFDEMIKKNKETVAILIFKKNNIQWHINVIQLSVIIVSTIITIFETSQKFLEQYVNQQILVIFPIILSSYIGLVLAVGRFFKYDDKNEKIIKLIEKYSFIINKFRQKSDNFESFDFKIKTLTDWDNLRDRDEKDNIGDIILKANEEKDLVLTPKELVFYKKKYTKTRLKELIESKNFNELGDLINNAEYPDVEISKLTKNIILKRNWCKYYCCFLWLCYDRDYVDYDKTVLKNAILLLKSIDSERVKDVRYYNRRQNGFSDSDDDDNTIAGKRADAERTELRNLILVMEKKLEEVDKKQVAIDARENIRAKLEADAQQREIFTNRKRNRIIPPSPSTSSSGSRTPPRRGGSPIGSPIRRGRSSSPRRRRSLVSDRRPPTRSVSPAEKKTTRPRRRSVEPENYSSLDDDNLTGEKINKFANDEMVIYTNKGGKKINCRISKSCMKAGRMIYKLQDTNGNTLIAKEKDLILNPEWQLKIGDRVKAKCKGWSVYLKGEIIKIYDDNTYDIKFDDGEKGDRIRKKRLALIKEYEGKKADYDEPSMAEPGVTLLVGDIDRGEGKTETEEKTIEEKKEKMINEFENEIWNEVKTYPTLIYGLTSIYDEIARDIRNTITVKHLMQYINDALDMPHTGTTREFCECIHAEIKSGNGITHADWLKYFKNAFKTRIIDLNKPGFVDDCVIDISGAHQEDISGNDISNNVIIDVSGNNSLV